MPRRRKKAHPRLVWEGRRETEARPAQLRELVQVAPSGESLGAGDLILGDNLAVMAGLLEAYEGRIDLIYADPPFRTGKAYRARVGRGEDSRQPEAWETTPGYADNWNDPGQYLNMLLPRLRLMHRLLAPTGSLYLHLDWHAAAYARVLLDEIFGPDRLLNEIVWVYHGPSPIRSAFKRKHDTILVYTKSKRYTFNADAVRTPYDPSTVRTFNASPRAGFGKRPDLERGKVPEDWWYFPVVARLHQERTGYPTQKPEALLERIVLASSNPGDLVADFFCGSGTTAAVAARLGRRWLACDLSPLAVHTTYRRLLLEGPPAFRLLAQEGRDLPGGLRPAVALESSPEGPRLRLSHLEGSQSRQPFPDNLDFWEVDWAYDGQVFHSRAQAARPWRGPSPPTEIPLPPEAGESGSVAVRAADARGRTGLVCLEGGSEDGRGAAQSASGMSSR